MMRHTAACGLNLFWSQPHREPSSSIPSPSERLRCHGWRKAIYPVAYPWLALPWTRDTYFMLEIALTLSAHCFLEKYTQDSAVQLAIRPLQRTTAADSGRPLSCEVTIPTTATLIANLATTVTVREYAWYHLPREAKLTQL